MKSNFEVPLLETMKRSLTTKLLSAAFMIGCLPFLVVANTRTLEMPFALSADARSEFSTRFPVLSAGRILLEATWAPATSEASIGLRITLNRPDGSIVGAKQGSSPLRYEYRASESEVEEFGTSSGTKWTVKIVSDADSKSGELSGRLRITVPVEIRVLEDTQFTLLGSGNAQEIAFDVPGPGRLEVQTSWENNGQQRASVVLLTVSLVHPGESKIYARRQGSSPVKVDQQVSELVLDRGSRWIVRVQNDTQTKVIGRVKVDYTPSL